MYKKATQHPAKKQKLARAAASATAPMKKDKPPVREVMVTEGPACPIPSLNRSVAERWSGV